MEEKRGANLVSEESVDDWVSDKNEDEIKGGNKEAEDRKKRDESKSINEEKPIHVKYRRIPEDELKKSRVKEEQNLSIKESKALSLVVSEIIKKNGAKCFLGVNKKAFTETLIELLKDQKATNTDQNQVKAFDNIIAHAETDGLKILDHYWYVTRALLNNYGTADKNMATKYLRNFPELPMIDDTEKYYVQLEKKEDFVKKINTQEDFVKKITKQKEQGKLFIGANKKEHKKLIAKIADDIYKVVKKEEKEIKYKDEVWFLKARSNPQKDFAEYATLNETYRQKAIEWGEQQESSVTKASSDKKLNEKLQDSITNKMMKYNKLNKY